MKRIATKLLTVILALVCAFAFTACNDKAVDAETFSKTAEKVAKAYMDKHKIDVDNSNFDDDNVNSIYSNLIFDDITLNVSSNNEYAQTKKIEYKENAEDTITKTKESETTESMKSELSVTVKNIDDVFFIRVTSLFVEKEYYENQRLDMTLTQNGTENTTNSQYDIGAIEDSSVEGGYKYYIRRHTIENNREINESGNWVETESFSTEYYVYESAETYKVVVLETLLAFNELIFSTFFPTVSTESSFFPSSGNDNAGIGSLLSMVESLVDFTKDSASINLTNVTIDIGTGDTSETVTKGKLSYSGTKIGGTTIKSTMTSKYESSQDEQDCKVKYSSALVKIDNPFEDAEENSSLRYENILKDFDFS